MSKSLEDNFRVERWNDDETELLETISKSMDNFVSQAAWLKACERFPQGLLVHYNNRFVMERRRPGEQSRSEKPRPSGRHTRPMVFAALTRFAWLTYRNGIGLARCAPIAITSAGSIAMRSPGASAATPSW